MGYYHFCTDGLKAGCLFYNQSQYAFGMTLIATITLLFNIKIYAFVLMPNHIHIILRKTSVLQSGRGDPSPTEISVNSAVGWLKYQITREINNKLNKTGEKVFQRSYYDHIIRDRDDYYRIYKYIKENPLCWQTDILYTE